MSRRMQRLLTRKCGRLDLDGLDSGVKLLSIPHRSMKLRRLELSVELTETKLRANTMRCVFETKLAVDIDVNDDELRRAFIDMVTQRAREMYGPAAMLAKSPPEVSVAMITRSGRKEVPLFAEAVRDESDD
jgi:hypothetical protein